MLEFLILVLKFSIILFITGIIGNYFLRIIIDYLFAQKEAYTTSVIGKLCIALGQTLQSAEQMKKSKE